METKRLNEIDRRDTSVYGPKAATLGELSQRGFNVPAGFALPASCLETFLRANHFPYAPRDLAAYSEETRDLIRGYSLQPELTHAVRQCVEDLARRFAGDPMIVRTSALCEDRRHGSMAGAFASFPGLVTPDNACDAVRECYGSLFSDAVLNRHAAGRIADHELTAGVIIQRYVAGEVSGVMFTADARQMNPEIAVISAVRGSCRGLTNGSKPATTYTWDKVSGTVREVYGDADILSADQLASLVDHAARIEDLTGDYQDIEWTIAQDRLYILQSRPITGFREPSKPDDWEDERLSASGNTWELKSDVCLPPLIAEFVVEAENQAGACAYSYGMPWDAVEMTDRHGYIFQRSREIPDAKKRLDALLKRLTAQWDRGEDEFDKHIRPELSQIIDAMHEHYIGRTLSDQDLLAYLSDAEFYMKRSSRLHWRATSAEWYIGHFFRQRVERFYDEIGAQDLVDIVYSKSLMTTERETLYEMVRVVQADPDLSELFGRFKHNRIIAARLDRMQGEAAQRLRQQIEAYSETYGWLFDGDWEDGSLQRPGTVPRAECISRIRRYLHVSIDDYRANVQQIADNAARLRAKGFEKCATDEDRTALEMALKAGEKAFLAGDNHAFYICSRKHVYICDAVTKIADVLVERGQIDLSDDIRFLYLEEIRASLIDRSPLHHRIAQRREEHARWRNVLPPDQIGSDETSPDARHEVGDEARDNVTVIKGESGTRKNVRGRIHVGFPGQPLDDEVILVLEHGHEGDLTTLLGCVAGLIVKMGTPASHMGIIARELGIPAIYGVGDSVSLLKAGDDVELRGRTGEIILEPDAV
jgi:pyruvate,water dikinase